MKAFFDIDTQLDFMAPGGALYGPGAERLIRPVAELNRRAASLGIPVISSTDAHPENADEFRVWPPHCVTGTFGQGKVGATLLEKRGVLPNDPAFDWGSFDTAVNQIIVEKNDLDLFSNPHLPALLEKLGIRECVVYGVFVDYCVKCAVMGLVRSGRRVSLVRDASDSISAEAGAAVVADFVALGGQVISSADAV